MDSKSASVTTTGSIAKGIRSLWLVLWIFVLLGQLGQLHWALDLFSHFTAHLFGLIIALTLLMLWSKNRVLTLVAFTALLLIVPFVSWYYWRGKGIDATQGETIRLVSTNVLTSNPNKSAVTTFLADSDADVIVLLEVSREWIPAIESLKGEFPFQKIVDRPDNFGIAMISKLNWIEIDQLQLDSSGVPTLDALIEKGGKRIRIIATHPLPPIGSERSKQRNEHFVGIANHLEGKKESVVVIGDLNCTSWSTYFRTLLARTDLKDSRQGFGMLPTWPSGYGFMMIPIDHALVSKKMEVIHRGIGPWIGSDHLPIIVDLRVP